MAKAQPINLSETDRTYLEAMTRARTLQAQTVNRAKILLQKANGESVDAIADKLDMNRNSVLLCLKKYQEGGVENAMSDAPGRGRNPEISDDERAWIIDIACRKPTEYGYAAEAWTQSKLTAHIQNTAEIAGYTRLSTISKSSIQRILDEADIKPFRIQYYCEKRDPDFERKMHEVLVVYKQVELQFDEDGNLKAFIDQPLHTISYDEKPGIQVLSTTSPDRRPVKGNGTVQRDYEYVRKGTISLLAGIDLLTGEAIPYISDTHKSSDFIVFLKKLDDKYPKADKIRLILDNHSAHTSKETRQFLATIPGRFEFVFTPKHGSWLNLVEGFFSKMTRQMLKGIRVSDKDELIMRIYKYFDEINESPVIYHWKYHMDQIDLGQEIGLAN
jgi:transposase